MAGYARALAVGAALQVAMLTRAISDKAFKTGGTCRGGLFFECAYHDTGEISVGNDAPRLSFFGR